jgi:hypothetical protein
MAIKNHERGSRWCPGQIASVCRAGASSGGSTSSEF